jgi:hypothetical protein
MTGVRLDGDSNLSYRGVALYGQHVKIERHWWNGSLSPRGRRDVYIRSDGQQWEVLAQTGGDAGRSRIHACPGRATAEILASAWRGAGAEWRELTPADDTQEHSRQTVSPSPRAVN